MLGIYFYIFVGVACIPLFISFIVSILICRNVYARYESKKDKYKWIALIAIIPALLLSAYKYIIIKEPLLLLAQFPIAFLICFFALWLFNAKIEMNKLLKFFIVLLKTGLVMILIYYHVRASFIHSIY